MPDGGAHEADLTADYNAEMIEQRARYRRLRDRSIFVGDPDDIVPDTFGADLPAIRDWTEANFEFSGYVTGFDPTELADREALRAELGYRRRRAGVRRRPSAGRVSAATSLRPGGRGGAGRPPARRRSSGSSSSPGRASTRARSRAATAWTLPPLRPRSLPSPRAPAIWRSCRVASPRAWNSTANRRPFIYVPLQHHFEQNFHVHHRLRAVRCRPRIDYQDAADPDVLAAAIVAELGRTVDYLPVEPDGAARAAASIAELL